MKDPLIGYIKGKKEVGRLTVPLLIVFSPNGRHVFKSDFYTVDQVRQALKKALEYSLPAS